MEGIQNLKDVLSLPMSLHMAVDKAGADGKYDANDLQYLIGPGMKVGAFISALGGALPELKDLSDEETQELYAWAKAEYDLADDAVEEKVESGLKLALHIAQFVGKLLPSEAPIIPVA